MKELKLNDGKYEINWLPEGGSMYALRNGKPWRDLTGDNLIFALLTLLDQTKEGFSAACAFIDSHVADPDITNEMIECYNKFLAIRKELEKK